MIEKVNPMHPDKIADRIAGAIVDLAYRLHENPKIAVEVLIGHEYGHIIIETNVDFDKEDIAMIFERIAGGDKEIRCDIRIYPQDERLAKNQAEECRCGDNGIFKGVPITDEQIAMSKIAREIYEKYPFDGKYILDETRLIICQSNADTKTLKQEYSYAEVNPLGDWTGGTDVDTGATNRKLGSDMADSVTGGGLHGKDLSKADVSVNIYAYFKAQETGEEVKLCCAIGDKEIDGKPYDEIVKIAKEYIDSVGGFEKFAELGLF
ncbi:TPA: S-adenosylmethionine synthetase [Streptococcus equi subsp. zooepidemicus]|nr:S-adenosylmethionine synthetase [Streptococcus equi subsp. zooepidemicus]HEL0568021.1 S-adenosylmethionine synthetase [Streptococcus equi subsp. zooepidemicus]HEL0587006.1 S-adenosylmethionine synthetase [Streptococcus equi subsp. zooepidemicus]HEL0643046.1 S-adenosylmethionine synthetase [Streptococcus equi subsp. zooepidemicus]HEL0722344.1 S-adenosylmethionine synthetase [Streptococcus equi subsp. zooepidemicus]